MFAKAGYIWVQQARTKVNFIYISFTIFITLLFFFFFFFEVSPEYIDSIAIQYVNFSQQSGSSNLIG